MNEELAQEVVKEIGGGKTKFFEANVLETESIAAAVKGALAWSNETGNEIGGVVAAAGVSTPAKVRMLSLSLIGGLSDSYCVLWYSPKISVQHSVKASCITCQSRCILLRIISQIERFALKFFVFCT
jgi:hypothetical protein